MKIPVDKKEPGCYTQFRCQADKPDGQKRKQKKLKKL